MDKKINILFLIDILAGYGGTEKHLIYLFSMLDKKKYNCIVVPFNINEDYLKMSSLGVKVIPIKIARYSLLNLVNLFRLVRIMKSNNIDIVQTFHFFSDTLGVLVSRLASVKKIISSRRDMGFKKGRFHLVINKIMNRHIDRFITVSDAVGDWISMHENVPKDRQVTIRNGIDLVSFKPLTGEERKAIRNELGMSETDFVVGIVGHIRPEKGHGMFFQAAYQLSRKIPNVRFVIVGGGDLYLCDTYRSFVKEKGFDDRTLFTGYVDDSMKYIHVFDVACLTSKTEGFSNAILEYMALEKPVVATTVGGNREVVIDGYNGFGVPPDSPEALEERLLFLYHEPELREKMGKQARKTVEEKFTVERMIEAHSNLYEETISGSRSHSNVAYPREVGLGN